MCHSTKLQPSPSRWELEAAAWHSQTMATQDNANKMPGIISLSPCATACKAYASSTLTPSSSSIRHRPRCGFMQPHRSLSNHLLPKSSHIQSTFISQPPIRCVNATAWKSNHGLLESPAITPGRFEADCASQCCINILRVMFWVKHPFGLVILWVKRTPGEGHKYRGNTLNCKVPWASSKQFMHVWMWVLVCADVLAYLYQQAICPANFWNTARQDYSGKKRWVAVSLR